MEEGKETDGGGGIGKHIDKEALIDVKACENGREVRHFLRASRRSA
jgi:hypothetical protein